MIARSVIVIVAHDSLARVAYEVEVCIEIARCDCCVCKVAVLGLSKERIILVSAFSTISASV